MKTAPQKADGTGTDLSEETLVAMEELGTVLKSIFLRMQKEGYQMVDGVIVHKDDLNERKED